MLPVSSFDARRTARVSPFYALTLSLVALLAAAHASQAQATGRRINPITIDRDVTALAQQMDVSTTAAQQILAISDDKDRWTPAQRKLSSDFIYAARMAQGREAAPGVSTLDTGLTPDAQGRVLAELHSEAGAVGEAGQALRSAIIAAGGEIVNDAGSTILVNVPLLQIEPLAGRDDVDGIMRYVSPRLVSSRSVASRLKALRERPLVPFSTEYRRKALDQRIAAAKAALRGTGLASVNSLTGPAQFLFGGLSLNVIGYDGTDTGTLGGGIKAHDVATAYTKYGVNGTGLRIGILSDGNRYLAASQTAKDLPPTDPNPTSTASTTSTVAVAVDDTQATPATQNGPSNNSGEGTAMMEIVHDIAPGAKIFFATAYNTSAQFAKNILLLRFKYKCDIIVDDVSYFAEAAFSDDNVAQAVNQVTNDGGLYFSSAGNEGHISQYSDPNPPLGNDSSFTASAWEGDYVEGTVSPTIGGAVRAGTVSLFNNGTKNPYDLQAYGIPYNIADFPATSSGTTSGTGSVYLYWADKTSGGTAANPTTVAGATNDYDLYVTDAAGTTVTASGTSTQAGGAAQQPYESANVKFGYRLYVLKKTTAAPCALHLTTFGSLYSDAPSMAFTTTGQVTGHPAAAQAFAVAANSVVSGEGGPGANPFNASNVSENFTSDGPRRVFWTVAGGPNLTLAVTPTQAANGYTLPVGIPVFTLVGTDLLFGTPGSSIARQKPEITAADGAVSGTAIPTTTGLNPFYGTSAAAPHAGAVAALVKSYSGTNGSGTTIVGTKLSVSEMRTILTASAIDIEKPGVDDTTGYGIVMPAPAIAFVRNFCNPNSVSVSTTTQNSAMITWTTNLPSSSVVTYMPKGGSSTTISGVSGVTSHSVLLTGLTPGTAYSYQVASATPTGSLTYADNAAGTARSFVTTPSTSVGTPNIAVSAMSAATAAATTTVTVTLKNTGTGTATNVVINTASLGSAGTSQSLPITVGTIAGNGGTATVDITFPTQASGASVLRLSGKDTGSGVTFSTASRITLP